MMLYSHRVPVLLRPTRYQTVGRRVIAFFGPALFMLLIRFSVVPVYSVLERQQAQAGCFSFKILVPPHFQQGCSFNL